MAAALAARHAADDELDQHEGDERHADGDDVRPPGREVGLRRDDPGEPEDGQGRAQGDARDEPVADVEDVEQSPTTMLTSRSRSPIAPTTMNVIMCRACQIRPGAHRLRDGPGGDDEVAGPGRADDGSTGTRPRPGRPRPRPARPPPPLPSAEEDRGLVVAVLRHRP